MSYDAHKNFAFSLVATAPSPASSGTSLVVTAGQGSTFPAVPFNAVICPAGSLPTNANAEIVRVTAIATDSFTITRAQESSSARTVVVGDQMFAAITAKSLTDIETPTGILDLSTSTAGQIKFPATQNPSANANTLDDYKEGTWTPVIGGAGGTSGQTYATQFGSYIKIGKLVIVNFNIALSVKGTITGNVQIQGLPFTIEALGAHEPVGSSYWVTASSLIGVLIVGTNGSTAASVFGATAAVTSPVNLVTGDLSNNSSFIGSLMYRAAA